MALFCASFLLSLLSLFCFPLFISAVTLQPGQDGFTPNLLSSFLNDSNYSSVVHSVSYLSNGDVIVAGTVTYPPGVEYHPGISNDDDLDLSDSTQTKRTSLILRLSVLNYTVVWAYRTVPCSAQTRFNLALDETQGAIYMSGATTGSTNSSDQALRPGAVIVRYSIHGIRQSIRVYGSEKHAYHFVTTVNSSLTNLLILGYCPSDPASDNRFSTLTQQGGLCATVVQKSDLSWVAFYDLTTSPVGVANATLRRDDWWHGTVSHDRSMVYVTIRRHVIINGFLPSSRPMILVFRCDNMQQIGSPVSLPQAHVPQHVRLAVTSNGVVYAAYIDRGGNKEAITVRRYDGTLGELKWVSSGSVEFVREIERELVIGRPVPSIVNAAIVLPKNNSIGQDGKAESVAILVYTAEIINRTLEDVSNLIMLTNPRIAIVVVAPSARVRWIGQSQLSHWWEPLTVAVDPNEQNTLLILGNDMGVTGSELFRAGGRMLATRTKVEGDDEDEKSPQTNEENSSNSDVDAFPTPTSTQSQSISRGRQACIGMSSHVKGQAILEIVKSNKRFRLQKHPVEVGMQAARHVLGLIAGRKKEGKNSNSVEMLCVQWNDDRARLCATELHVIRIEERLFYMKEMCDDLSSWKMFDGAKCERAMDVPFNFKAMCSQDIEVNSGMRITMHSGQVGQPAEAVAYDECQLQKSNALLWRLKTI